jgi:hypothetical protein
MAKKPFFLRKFGGLVLAVLLVVGVFSGVSEAKSFGWTNSNVCTPTTVCGSYIYVWTLQDYCSKVATDCTYDTRPYDQVPGGKGIFIPYDKHDILKSNYLLKVKVMPESYETTSIKISKDNFPVPYDTKFVSVVVAYERETVGTSAGRELESEFSNRVMWLTPKKLGFTIKISKKDPETGDITILIVSNDAIGMDEVQIGM